MKPKISVILPVYNAEKYLRYTLDSVLGGSFSDFEIVAVNDGSKDSSLAILEEYRERDARVKVIDKPNTGVSDTRNVGIAAAEGDYIAFLDADDVYSPEYLERMYSVAEAYGADVTVCSYMTFRGDAPTFPTAESREAKPTTIRELLDTGLMTSMCVKLIKRGIFENNNICFSNDYRYSEDLFCSWKICAISKSTYLISDKLYGYRLTGHGATSKFYDNLYRQYKKAFEDIRSFLHEHNLEQEEKDLDLSFTRGLPAFLLMIARKNATIRSKVNEIKEILQDKTIINVLNEDINNIMTSRIDKKMYVNAKKKRACLLLWHGYYMHWRMRLANLLKH